MKTIQTNFSRLSPLDSRKHPLRSVVGLLLLIAAWGVQATAVPDPTNITRTNKFTYDTSGLLSSIIVEPTNADNCQQTTVTRDNFGDAKVVSIANCSTITPPASAVFVSKTTTDLYEAGSPSISVGGAATTIPYLAGQFLTTTTGPLGQPVKRTYDARFGTVSQETDVNGNVTSNVWDGFGRQVRSTSPDGTYAVTSYCLLSNGGLDSSQTSNSATCPTTFGAGEVPPDAIALTQVINYAADGTQISGFSREYTDRLHRQLRTVTQSFDGASQPAALAGALVAKDTVYNNYGAVAYTTSPYFATGSSTTVGANDVHVTAVVYDALGRPTFQYDSNENASSTYAFTSSQAVSYGQYPSAKATVASHTYSGLSVKDTNALGDSKTAEFGVTGKVLRITDWDRTGNNGSQVAYQYTAVGALWKVQDALQNQAVATYDFRGNRLTFNDPDKGAMTYQYDAANQLVAQQSPVERSKNTSTTFTYDASGRHLTEANFDGTLQWYYDHDSTGASCVASTGTTYGVLCETKQTIAQQAGIDRRYQYDALTRPVAQRLDTGASQTSATPSFGFSWSYDSAGRLATKTYPSGLQVAYNYTSLGSLSSVSAVTALSVRPLAGTAAPVNVDWPSGKILWAQRRAGADGFLEKEMFADNSFDIRTRQSSARQISTITSGIGDTSGDTSIANYSYVWDVQGNLKSRTDRNGDGTTGLASSGEVDEGFGYDDLNRLTSYSVTAPGVAGYVRSVNLTYNALGNILYKTDVGNYAYAQSGSALPHAAQNVNGVIYGYDANGNLLSATGGRYGSLTYTSFDRVATASSPDSSVSYAWSYDESLDRVKELRTSHGNTRTLWYLNKPDLGFEYEQDSATSPLALSARNSISAGGQTVAVLAGAVPVITLGANQFAPAAASTLTLNKAEFWHTDHLGSLVATTDDAGAVTQRYAYDPFGKRRMTAGGDDPTGSLVYDWNPNSNSGTPRGFTAHEQLDDIGVVNMNGRIYDAERGQFMQADAHVTDIRDLQSLNRFSYGRNNPLNRTDPTGFEDVTPGNSGLNWALSQFVRSLTDSFRSWVNSFGSDNTGAQPSGGIGGGAAPEATQKVEITGQRLVDKTVKQYERERLRDLNQAKGAALAGARAILNRGVLRPSTVGRVTVSAWEWAALRASVGAGLLLYSGGIDPNEDAEMDARFAQWQAAHASNNDDDSSSTGAADTDGTNSGDKPNLLDPKGETHVLDGDATGGGHRPGTGKPGKSEFPPNWSDDKIKGEISDVATDPKSTRTPGRGGRTIVQGTRDGVDITVVVEPGSKGGRIVTGFPTNVPRNPK